MGQPKLDTATVPGGEGPRHRIELLGRLYLALRASQLPSETKERLAAQVERFQSDILDRTRLLERLESGAGRDVGPTADRLLQVIDLCREGAFIDVPNAAGARTAAQDLMKRADFLDRNLAGAARTEIGRAPV